MPNTFLDRKRKILDQLAIPEQEYTDLSPKGSVDAGVRELCDEINGLEGFVTTSSCAGRVAVFLEGASRVVEAEDDSEPGRASQGGGKGGGRWLYVSHDPVDESKIPESDGEMYKFFGLENQDGSSAAAASSEAPSRFIHFKFEPMILHILTSSLEHAQHALSSAMTSGFRESGISTVTGADPTPMVAVRTQGLAFDCIIASSDVEGRITPLVSESYLRMMVRMSNQRFAINTERKERFRRALLKLDARESNDWEPADVRRERKRAEGLRKREEVLRRKEVENGSRDSADIEDDSPAGLFSDTAPS